MSTAESKTIKLFCPLLSKLVPFVAYEDHRLDLGTIARTFGLDPATLRLNGHFVSRGVNLISSVTWKSLLSFFDSRGFSTGTNGRDAVIVDGKFCRPDVANGGLHNPSNNGNRDDPRTTEDDGVGIKRKPQSEDVKFLKKRKMDRRSSGIYLSWEEARLKVDGYSGSRFRSFKNWREAAAYWESYHSGTIAQASIVSPHIEAPAPHSSDGLASWRTSWSSTQQKT